MYVLVYSNSTREQPGLARCLHQLGIQVDMCTNRERLLHLCTVEHYVAIIFLNIPTREVCLALTEWSSTTRDTSITIVLTRNQSCLERAVALKAGIHEYFMYPYSYSRVLRAILGHSFSPDYERTNRTEVSHVTPNLRLDLIAHQAYANGMCLRLTSTEFRMLALFMKYPGKVISRVQIWEDVWGYKDYTLTNTIDVHVSRLRRKMGSIRRIETVYGVGYQMLEIG